MELGCSYLGSHAAGHGVVKQVGDQINNPAKERTIKVSINMNKSVYLFSSR